MENRITALELKYENLEKTITLVDEYSRQIMNHTMTQLSIMIAVATGIIILAAWVVIKQMLNSKIENEVEKKVVKVLGNNPPLFYTKGEDLPDSKGEIFLSSEIEGINDLEPRTVMINEVRSAVTTGDELENKLIPKLLINENGTRVIRIENYHVTNGKITWSLAWVRKQYK